MSYKQKCFLILEFLTQFFMTSQLVAPTDLPVRSLYEDYISYKVLKLNINLNYFSLINFMSTKKYLSGVNVWVCDKGKCNPVPKVPVD